MRPINRCAVFDEGQIEGNGRKASSSGMTKSPYQRRLAFTVIEGDARKRLGPEDLLIALWMDDAWTPPKCCRDPERAVIDEFRRRMGEPDSKRRVLDQLREMGWRPKA
jgi:hypothetical protein